MRRIWLIVGAAAALAVVATIGLALSSHGRWLVIGRQSPAPTSTSDSVAAALQFSSLPEPKLLPPLHFTDAEGKSLTLADFRGRVVLLNIWATWCVPCRGEMATLDRLQAMLGGPDFLVLALSIDRKGLEIVKPFYAELGLKSLGIYVDQSGNAAHELGTVGVPTTLLIDREGRELGRKLGPAEWDGLEAIALIHRATRGAQ